jgi:chorismate mutase
MSDVPGLKRLRNRIDALDKKVLAVLAQRFEVVQAIGAVKRVHGLETLQKGRWQTLLATRLAQGAALGLDARFTRAVFEAVHDEALRIQRAQARKRSRR